MAQTSSGTDVQRPTFFEGQILSAADLTATVDHARNHAARHDRYLHEWGIAEGLTLVAEPRTEPSGAVTVTLRPGVAVDGTGREILVPAPVTLSETQFGETVGSGSSPADRHPVLLAGLDREPVATGLLDDTGADRIDESYQVLFRRAGDERLVAEQVPPAVGDGPGDGTEPWLILIGYVTWRDDHFTAVTTTGPVPVRYAGVRADTVAARSGALALRARPEPAQGGSVLTVADSTGLTFGRFRADGSVDPLLVVTPDGDLTVRGSGAQRPGTTSVASGVATDGMVLPLPAGVDETRVTNGATLLHITVTPQSSGVAPATDGVWLPGTVDCSVDEDRRLRCRIRWLRVDASGPQWHDLPGAASFLVLATTAEAGEGSAA
ncbi:hypothetical protein [Actinoplanes sp. NBRC 101535]|uniref:hypothetical protein n=1 Tax=Actinoplanes sp. NBRC 101535 TaxID=3032196 RepID=UPI0024A477A6|nr:hypothetical protein [Actinoplanes sp. NBRC 101535]GLY05340.1 hypothetical protein Acsp01_57190 [Actinoplanes sp. NBRC 101535]